MDSKLTRCVSGWRWLRVACRVAKQKQQLFFDTPKREKKNALRFTCAGVCKYLNHSFLGLWS